MDWRTLVAIRSNLGNRGFQPFCHGLVVNRIDCSILTQVIIWLVVEPYPSEKYEFISAEYEIPNMLGKSFKIPWFQSPPTSHRWWWLYYLRQPWKQVSQSDLWGKTVAKPGTGHHWTGDEFEVKAHAFMVAIWACVWAWAFLSAMEWSGFAKCKLQICGCDALTCCENSRKLLASKRKHGNGNMLIQKNYADSKGTVDETKAERLSKYS